MTTLSDIEKLAQKTANEALKEDTPLQSRIDALKSLTPYYTALKKAESNQPEESDEPTIEGLREQMAEAENGHGGNPRVQARNRPRN
jgi:hypothetical protein